MDGEGPATVSRLWFDENRRFVVELDGRTLRFGPVTSIGAFRSGDRARVTEIRMESISSVERKEGARFVTLHSAEKTMRGTQLPQKLHFATPELQTKAFAALRRALPRASHTATRPSRRAALHWISGGAFLFAGAFFLSGRIAAGEDLGGGRRGRAFGRLLELLGESIGPAGVLWLFLAMGAGFIAFAAFRWIRPPHIESLYNDDRPLATRALANGLVLVLAVALLLLSIVTWDKEAVYEAHRKWKAAEARAGNKGARPIDDAEHERLVEQIEDGVDRLSADIDAIHARIDAALEKQRAEQEALELESDEPASGDATGTEGLREEKGEKRKEK